MKSLAFVGLVALLTMIAWGTLKLGGFFPAVRGTLTGGVVSLDSLFGGSEKESLEFVLDRKVFPVGREVVVPFTHTSPRDPHSSYKFTYECKSAVQFDVKNNGVWKQVACGEPYTLPTGTNSITLIASSNETRYVDVPLTIKVEGSEIRAGVVVTVENARIAATRDSFFVNATSSIDTTKESDGSKSPSTPAQSPTPLVTPASPPAVRPSVSEPIVVPSGPQDLSVGITGTGVLLDASKTTSFVARSVIPSDGTAAIRFTVSNVGGAASGPWGFIANLPIEGDADYRYTSPLQSSLKPGERIEFTLSFDEVRNAKNGAITITLLPASGADSARNNRDTRIITISEK